MFVVVEVDFVVIGHGIVTHVTVAAGVASIEIAVELLVVDAMLIVEGGGVVVDGAGDSLDNIRNGDDDADNNADNQLNLKPSSFFKPFPCRNRTSTSFACFLFVRRTHEASSLLAHIPTIYECCFSLMVPRARIELAIGPYQGPVIPLN